MAISDNGRGALMMMASMTSFTINDTFMKLLSADMPLFQMLFLRGFGSIIAMVFIARHMGMLRFDFSRKDWGLVALRSGAEIGSTYFFLTALFHMPLANVSAIFQALPLAITLAGAVFLSEPVGWKRLTAIIIGFGGVMLVVRPGTEDFNFYTIYALASVACVVVRDLSTRRMSRSVPSMMVALAAGVAVTVASGLASLGDTWVMPSVIGGLQLFGALVFVVSGYLLSVMTMRVGDLGFVAPFRYFGLVVALVLGLVVFHDFPDFLTLTGSAIIVATGLFTLYREARVVKKSPRPTMAIQTPAP